MSYQAEISRVNPTAFVFLIDQSGSMSDPFRQGDVHIPKAQALADTLNRTFSELTMRCSKDGEVRDYYSLLLIGYGGVAGPAWAGPLAGRIEVPIAEVAANPARIEQRQKLFSDGAGGLEPKTIHFPIWIDPVATSGTPMVAALNMARDHLTTWIAHHPTAYPPIVFNITDGMSTDGDPSAVAEALRELGTTDGKVLLANLHLSATSPFPVRYPASAGELPPTDDYAHLLWEMSSPLLPEWIEQLTALTGLSLTPDNRCFVYNSGLEDMIQLLEIGTKQDLR